MQAEIIHEEVLTPLDSLAMANPGTFVEYNGPFSPSLIDIFIEGGMVPMIVITLFLIALLVAAWKAPRWVKEIGIGALVVGFFFFLYGVSVVFDCLQMFGDQGVQILAGGLKVTLIPLFYALIVYFISLIIRIIHKPRI